MKKSIKPIVLVLLFMVFLGLPDDPAQARISADNAFQGGLEEFEAGSYSRAMMRWNQAIWYAIDEKKKEGWPMTGTDYQIGALAYLYRGLTYQKLNQPGLAIADFANAERWSDGMSEIQLNIAAQYFRQEMLEETIRVCRNVLKSDPQNGQAHYLLGYTYYKKKDTASALEHAQKSREAGYPFADFLMKKLQEDGTNDNTANNPVETNEELPADYLALVTKYYEKGDYQKSIDICRKVLQREPENGMAHYYLGYSLYATRDYAKALEHARLARDNGVPYADLLIEKLEGKK